jgi:hypothetical protein
MRERRVKRGFCARCGESRDLDGTTYYCRPCADHEAARQKQRRKQESNPDPLLKPRDPAKVAKNIKRMRHRRTASGLCVDCRDRRGFNGTGTRCRPCADEHAEKQRGRRERERDPYGILAMQERAWEREQEQWLMKIDKQGGLTPVVIYRQRK